MTAELAHSFCRGSRTWRLLLQPFLPLPSPPVPGDILDSRWVSWLSACRRSSLCMHGGPISMFCDIKNHRLISLISPFQVLAAPVRSLNHTVLTRTAAMPNPRLKLCGALWPARWMWRLGGAFRRWCGCSYLILRCIGYGAMGVVFAARYLAPSSAFRNGGSGGSSGRTKELSMAPRSRPEPSNVAIKVRWLSCTTFCDSCM